MACPPTTEHRAQPIQGARSSRECAPDGTARAGRRESRQLASRPPAPILTGGAGQHQSLFPEDLRGVGIAQSGGSGSCVCRHRSTGGVPARASCPTLPESSHKSRLCQAILLSRAGLAWRHHWIPAHHRRDATRRLFVAGRREARALPLPRALRASGGRTTAVGFGKLKAGVSAVPRRSQEGEAQIPTSVEAGEARPRRPAHALSAKPGAPRNSAGHGSHIQPAPFPRKRVAPANQGKR